MTLPRMHLACMETAMQWLDNPAVLIHTSHAHRTQERASPQVPQCTSRAHRTQGRASHKSPSAQRVNQAAAGTADLRWYREAATHSCCSSLWRQYCGHSVATTQAVQEHMAAKADWFLAKVATKRNHCHAIALANTLGCCSMFRKSTTSLSSSTYATTRTHDWVQLYSPDAATQPGNNCRKMPTSLQ